MTSEENVLEAAAAELAAAQEALVAARRNLTMVIVAACRDGVPAARIAGRAGLSVTEVRNILAATGTSHRT
ncbi:hypothetical protein QZH56_17945 [Streptomyces olivoreticuli]|uniref:hypothetical protein n=1 Tax=Streptomyces olivoreticuli TaxID=68246 RepID=UPI002659F63D|nr:hypothetical protein [Streptomyces olivoreticuli]WKK27302.1 hypothetical protein QZH56_17945 [Streptomyces olivoreticuli]